MAIGWAASLHYKVDEMIKLEMWRMGSLEIKLFLWNVTAAHAESLGLDCFVWKSREVQTVTDQGLDLINCGVTRKQPRETGGLTTFIVNVDMASSTEV